MFLCWMGNFAVDVRAEPVGPVNVFIQFELRNNHYYTMEAVSQTSVCTHSLPQTEGFIKDESGLKALHKVVLEVYSFLLM